MKKTFRFVGLILISVLSYGLTSCGSDGDDDGGSGGGVDYTSDEIVEMLTGKWEVYGHAKATSNIENPSDFDSDYTGSIEFGANQSVKAKSTVMKEVKEEGGYTYNITLGSILDSSYKYKITRKNGATYISFGSDNYPKDFKIVSLTKKSFKLVMNQDFEGWDMKQSYTTHAEITIISQ